jgi:DNA replication and repair protein RecF
MSVSTSPFWHVGTGPLERIVRQAIHSEPQGQQTSLPGPGDVPANTGRSRHDGEAVRETDGSLAGRVWLTRLSLAQFRNYAAAELIVDARPVVLTGPNGAGKTNLLEAVSLLAPGRGLRRSTLSELQRRHPSGEDRDPVSDGWAVAAEAMTPDGSRQLGTGRDPNAGEASREKRAVKLDGAFAGNQQALGEVISVVWLTPQMDRLFLEGPAGRRRFLDRLVYAFDPAHAGRVSAYERSLRERARVLKGEAGRPDAAWLQALEENMAGRAVAIAAARREMVARLAQSCAAAAGAFPRAGLGLDGDVESWLDDMAAVEAEEAMAARLVEARNRDTEAGGAGVGPHRTDLLVRHLAKDMPADLCSTGEQKALLISIVLAHARLIALSRGAAPLLLLDEVAAHLDTERRGALFEEILALGAQAWLTGTDRALFEAFGSRAQYFQVREATITADAPTPDEKTETAATPAAAQTSWKKPS